LECFQESFPSPQHLHGLEQLKVDFPEVGPRIIVCLEERPRLLDNGILVLPALEFLRRLWAGAILGEAP